MSERYTYLFDIAKQKVLSECKLYPTEILQSEFPWLYARNNKYPRETDVDPEKIGKWMLFLSKKGVNAVWDHIKKATTCGDLWLAKVSTSDPTTSTHAIMIYTKDYSDRNDVIRVLDFLESSGLKSPNVIIYYKTDQQTYAGIYAGGQEKPWIYSSKTIRQMVAPGANYAGQ